MRKFFVILAFLAFTFNVKADYAPIDIQIAEGEEYVIDQIVAAQVINQTSWDGQYILTGGVARIYIDFLPRQWPDGRSNILFRGWYVEQKAGGGWWLYHEGEGGSARAPTITFDSPFDAYQWLISDEGIEYCGYWMTTQDDEDGLGEYIDTSYMSTIGFRNSTSSDSANWVLEQNQESLAKMQNRMQFVTQTDLLNYAQVPINGVHITITNAAGQVTQDGYRDILLGIKSVLEAISNKLGTTNNLLSDVVDGLGDIYENELLWHTEWAIFANSLTNFLNSSTNNIDYTELLKYYIYSGVNNITNNQAKNNLELLYMYPEALPWNFGLPSSLDTLEFQKLYGQWYWGMYSLYQLLETSFWGENPSISMFQLSQDILKYNTDLVLAYNDFERKDTALSWLTLATNDISSLPYWLNQQDYSLIGGTNTLTRFDVITNQYAHIGLTGSGQQANSTETWNYFKRLEMLLAALVYKQTDYEGNIDPHEIGNNASVSSSVASGEDQINTSLTAVKDALTLSTIGNAKNSIVSLFQTATSAFDVTGEKRVINVMETDVAGGNEGAGITVNLDFTQGELGDFADFIHHLFGFLWGFASLFIFWRVCKFCWDMGYKVVKFHYSLCRKFLGI